MRKAVIVLGFFALLASAGVRRISGDLPQRSMDLKSKKTVSKTAYAPDRLLVKFKDDVRGNVSASAGQAYAESLYGLAKVKHYKSIDANLYKVGGDLLKTMKKLRKMPNVAYAEPDYLRTATETVPNDPSFGTLWAMHNTGQAGGTSGADLDMLRAWDITTGSENVVVAVIDSGVRYDHPDLAANMWTNPGEIPGNGVDDDGDGYVDDVHGINAITGSGDPLDDNSHGTHCAGTIAAAGNNGLGVVGVCWTAKIMALKFLNSRGSGYTSDAVECIEYAIAKGARILSNSWGGGGYSQALLDAIEAAGGAGILFVAAAGNEGVDIDYGFDYPAAYSSPNIVAVAATDHNDQRPYWSNTGRISVDVAAPGVDIYSTNSENSYETMSGTSMATPHVAGLAALLESFEPSWDWRELKMRIMTGVEVLPQLQSDVLTGGRINAYNSLTAQPVESYRLAVQSLTGEALPIIVTPADLDGNASGSTNFVRRYAPYAAVTITAPAVLGGNPFSCWTVDGVRMRSGVTLTLPLDFNHVAVPTYSVPLAQALDNSALSFVSGGYGVGWEGQTPVSYSGGSAARNRAIGDNQSAYLQTSIEGPGFVSFYWKVSSEVWDYLRVYLDSTSCDYLSDELGWFHRLVVIPEGVHVVKWVYEKDAAVARGADCGYVDEVWYDGLPATLATAVDDDMGAWATSDGGGWFSQGYVFHDDGDAAQTSPLLDGQQAAAQTVINGPTTGSFYWKVSSEADGDLLTFFIDDVPQMSISGEVDWRQETFTLGAGEHTLKWVYAKDDALSVGADAAWLDQVAYDLTDTPDLTIRTATTGGGSGGTTNPAPGTYTHGAGESVSIAAIPSEGYRFSGWTGNVPTGHEHDNPLVVGLTSDRTITANFVLRVTLDMTMATEYGENGGMTQPNPGSYVYDYGTVVALRAMPAGDFRFKGWTGDVPAGHGLDNPVDIHMDGDRSVTGNFVRQYTLHVWSWTFDGVDGGTTVPGEGHYTLDAMSTSRLQAIPATDFTFAGWDFDVEAGHETDNPLSVTMNDSKAIQARFLRNIYAPATSGRHVFNRSLLIGEYINELTWEPDPRNSAPGLTISKYRVYLVNGGTRTMLAELDAGTLSWLHRNVERDGAYTYAICAVSSTDRDGDYGLIRFEGANVSRMDSRGRAGAGVRRGTIQNGREPVKVKKVMRVPGDRTGR